MLFKKRYEIVGLLGQGDFGIVYQARDRQTADIDKFVALKQMPMQMIGNCERQADLRATLIHPVIPPILDYFSDRENAYLVQEFINGSKLEVVIMRAVENDLDLGLSTANEMQLALENLGK